jgi:type II secretory pathway component GspD/PulD (secretin)
VAFESNLISLKLAPEVSAIKQWKQTPSGDFPVISSRKVETELRVKNGESFVIGGLLNEDERENTSKVPVLGDIPLINGLFRSTTNEKSKSDVVFLVTARKL